MIILQYLLQHLTLDYFNFSYISIFILLIICGLGIPIPEDLTLLMAGVICSLSKSNKTPLSLSGMILVCLVGILAGDSAMFFVGYFLKDKMSDFFIFRAIFKHKYYKIIQNKIAKFGYGLLFLARFLPGVRALIFVVSGSSHKIRYILFLFLDLLAALISVPLLVYAGYYFATDLTYIIKIIKKSELLFIFSIVLIIALLIVYNYYRKKRK